MLRRVRGERGGAMELGLFCLAVLLGLSMALPVSAAAACPNEDLRFGPSASLPDCRAYELVTPANSDGRNFGGIESSLPFNMFPTTLVSPSGGSILFMTQYSPLLEPPSSTGFLDLYQAERSSSGWQVVRRLSPSGAEAVIPNAGGVSADHLYTFVQVGPIQQTEDGGTLAEGGDATYLGKPDGSFELLGQGSLAEEPDAQGRFISEGGSHVIFSTGGVWCGLDSSCEIRQLEPDAPETGTPAVYDREADGPTRVVSLLPGEETPADPSAFLGNSRDGTVVAFESAGTFYVRVNNADTKVVTAGPATFGGLSVDGDQLTYLRENNIFQFDSSGGATTQVTNSGDAEVVNVSADGSHVYFLSPSVLTGSSASPGAPNLYMWTASTGIKYVATVSPADLEGFPALNKWTTWAVSPEKGLGQGPGADSSRSTPDGNVLVFESHAKLTEYANDGYREIYRYEASTGALTCISCNPTGQPATADAHFENLTALNLTLGGASLEINNVTDDGSRVFFETAEALVQSDVDGVNDIYEWNGSGPAGSSLELISSGQSPYFVNPEYPVESEQEPNVLLGVTPQGQDVMFLAYEALVPQAGRGGVPAIYDARIGGGFPLPPSAPECIGEECQGAVSGQLPLVSPGSETFEGGGNVRHHRCRRGRREGAKRPHSRKKCHGKRRPGQRK